MKRRCLILTSEYPPWTIGGVGRYVAEVAPRLAPTFEVQVVLVPSYRALASDAVPAQSRGVRVHVCGDEYRRALIGVGADLAFAPLAAAARRLVEQLGALLDGSESAIVYVQEYSLAPIAAALLERWRNATIVAACHLPVYAGFTYFDKPVRDALHQVLEAKLVALATRVIVPSRFTAQILALTHNVGRKLTVAPLGVSRPAALRAAARTATRLLAVGRTTEQKGHHMLVDVFERLHDTRPALQLTILCGDGASAALAARVSSGRAAGAIRLAPAVPQADIWRVYDEHDLLLSTSLYETFGLCVLEAMASGRLTLGYATPALRELWGADLAAEVGVPVARPERLVDRVHTLCAQPERAAELAQRLQQRAAAFTWQRHLDTLVPALAGCAAVTQ